ncbi:hypothetical protein FJY63_11935 [Candidatus Sumerlaeota bacterium]|nr:hypothetical protein [Candidatus Sumerlaeota bacterium]
MIPLRADILAGDLRCLYLGWLLGVEDREAEDEEESAQTSPPAPKGLPELSGPLNDFVEFFQLDTDLVAAAAQKSAPLSLATVADREFSEWLVGLSAREKDSILRRIGEGHDLHLRAELLSRFRRARAEECGCDRGSEMPPPSANELWEESQKIAELRRAREAERRRIEKEKKEMEEAARRKEYLAALAAREETVWKEVEKRISASQPKPYDAAVGFLKDLHELSVSKNNEAAFLVRLRELRQRHHKKETFLRRLDKAGLPTQERAVNLPIQESQEQ